MEYVFVVITLKGSIVGVYTDYNKAVAAQISSDEECRISQEPVIR